MEKVKQCDLETDAWSNDLSLLTDRVERQLRRYIQNLRVGAMLPTQEILVREFGASRHTIREAMERLKRDRLIQSTRGRGTFVASRRQTQTVVHLVSSSVYHVYNLMCIGVLTDVLRERGHRVHLVGSRTPGAECQELTGGYEPSAGSIMIGNFPREEIQRLVECGDLPLVHVSDMNERYRRAPLCDTVINDNAALAFRATEYLLQQGHRRIALLGWGPEKIWDRELRRGYEEALQAHGVEPSADWILRLPEGVSPDTGRAMEKNAQQESQSRRQIEQWRASDAAPTALLHNAGAELQMRECLAEYFPGLFDPRAVVVMTYWEMLRSNYTGESDATAVCLKFRDIAERAVDLLNHRRTDGAPPTREMQGRIFIAQRRQSQWLET
ncbi:MAG: GntR family transcriptional regulator [Phycisphaerae bacterium]|nr:GntR family transcriptional regulator [Phycisphaerae bacterium]